MVFMGKAWTLKDARDVAGTEPLVSVSLGARLGLPGAPWRRGEEEVRRTYRRLEGSLKEAAQGSQRELRILGHILLVFATHSVV